MNTEKKHMSMSCVCQCVCVCVCVGGGGWEGGLWDGNYIVFA